MIVIVDCGCDVDLVVGRRSGCCVVRERVGARLGLYRCAEIVACSVNHDWSWSLSWSLGCLDVNHGTMVRHQNAL